MHRFLEGAGLFFALIFFIACAGGKPASSAPCEGTDAYVPFSFRYVRGVCGTYEPRDDTFTFAVNSETHPDPLIGFSVRNSFSYVMNFEFSGVVQLYNGFHAYTYSDLWCLGAIRNHDCDSTDISSYHSNAGSAYRNLRVFTGPFGGVFSQYSGGSSSPFFELADAVRTALSLPAVDPATIAPIAPAPVPPALALLGSGVAALGLARLLRRSRPAPAGG